MHMFIAVSRIRIRVDIGISTESGKFAIVFIGKISRGGGVSEEHKLSNQDIGSKKFKALLRENIFPVM